jgi:protoporphyrin/coproporphyrin ferrochelatase
VRYDPEPPHEHGRVPKTGILLVSLGTPEAPTAAAVRRYLAQFLWDPRVVEIPRVVWWPVLHGAVLRLRPRESARRYARIWTPEGSPLKLHAERQARLLRGYLGLRVRAPLAVEVAMRYGEPAIGHVLARLKDEECDRVLVLPLYPQYSASTTASAFDEVAAFLRRVRNAPAVRMVRHFHDHPEYIAALAGVVREHWLAGGRPDRLVMSFHGLPRRSLERGDPYHCECQKTARLLARELGLADGQWLIAFQSRFGAGEWLRPYTAAVLAELGRSRTRRVDVICPGFVADCLETLEEIGIEGKRAFLAAGGGEFHLLPALNEHDGWIRALASIALENLSGWIGTDWDAQRAAAAADESRRRALAGGAPS